MDLVFSSVKDIIKHKSISSINTGDKALDALFITLVSAILTLVFTFDYWKPKLEQVKLKWASIRGKIDCIIPENYELLRKMVNEPKNKNLYQVAQWDSPTDSEFLYRLLYHVKRTVPSNSSSLTFNSKTFCVAERQYEENSQDISKIKTELYSRLQGEELYPLFMHNKEIVCITTKVGQGVYIAFKTLQNFELFYSFLMKINLGVKIEKTSGSHKIFQSEKLRHNDTSYYPLSKTRTFDLVISKHKQTIINSLKDFQYALQGVSKFNGYGSYNLGIILHGVPGTGKTSIIKAICNFLGRDAIIVDMRKVKTCTDFKELFGTTKNVLERVYIFEEFDGVQGVLSRDNKDSDGNNQTKNIKKRLREEYLKLLEIQHVENKETKNITKELNKIQEKMDELDEALTCDTMLTVLDGMEEFRGRVIIATTNYIDRIDKALLREGRFDLKIKLEQFNDSEIRELLTKMYTPKETESMEGGESHKTEGDPTREKVNLDYMKDKKFREGEFTPVQIINLCHKLQKFETVVDELCVK